MYVHLWIIVENFCDFAQKQLQKSAGETLLLGGMAGQVGIGKEGEDWGLVGKPGKGVGDGVLG